MFCQRVKKISRGKQRDLPDVAGDKKHVEWQKSVLDDVTLRQEFGFMILA